MLSPALDDADQSFLQLLRAQPDATIAGLCQAAGVTATAVRQRLSRLQSLGLVTRVTIRTGRGRPFHQYQLTNAGHRVLGDNYAELALLLWDSVRQIEDPAIRNEVLGRIRNRLAARYGRGVSGSTLEQRMTALQQSLSEQGFQMDVGSRDGLPLLRERHCPYHELAQADAGICDLEQQVYEAVLGVPLVLTQCCRQGQGICEFQPQTTALQ